MRLLESRELLVFEVSKEELIAMRNCLALAPTLPVEGLRDAEASSQESSAHAHIVAEKIDEWIYHLSSSGDEFMNAAFKTTWIKDIENSLDAVESGVSDLDFHTVVGVSKYTVYTVLSEFKKLSHSDFEKDDSFNSYLRSASRTGGMVSCGWNFDGSRLGVTFRNGALIWDFDSGHFLKKFALGDPLILDFEWAPTGGFIGTAGRGGVILREEEEKQSSIIFLSKYPSRSCSWSPCASMIAATDGRGLHVWNVKSFSQVMSHLIPLKKGASCVWSEDGGVLALYAGREIIFWDADFHSVTKKLPEGFPHNPLSTSWSPNLRQIVVVDDSTVGLWNVSLESVEPVKLIPLKNIYSSSWDRQGGRVAFGGREGEVWIWNVDKGAQIRQLSGHSDAVVGCSWSRDGRFIATASHDGTVRVWCSRSGECRLILGRTGDCFFSNLDSSANPEDFNLWA